MYNGVVMIPWESNEDEDKNVKRPKHPKGAEVRRQLQIDSGRLPVSDAETLVFNVRIKPRTRETLKALAGELGLEPTELVRIYIALGIERTQAELGVKDDAT